MSMGIIETLQAEIQSLKERVTALEQLTKGSSDTPAPAPRQLTRDDIIEMAKRDIESLGEKDKYGIYYEPWEGFKCYANFVVNREKRTVVALLKWRGDNNVLARGIAKCHPDDCFNAHIGRAIALRRALGLEVPEAYLNAPQPTEVRAGDVVKWGDGSIYRIKNISGKEYTFEKLNEKFESIRFISRVPYPRGIEKFSKVIDDTRDEV
jgi:hypothetical protein